MLHLAYEASSVLIASSPLQEREKQKNFKKEINFALRLESSNVGQEHWNLAKRGDDTIKMAIV